MADQVIQLNTGNPIVRLLQIITLVLALICSWFVVRWYIGDTLAEYLNPETDDVETARRAVSLAPDDPFTHWRLAEFTQKRLPPEEMVHAVKEYEQATILSPTDYRLWMAYGTALEEVGEKERAEKALRQAVELAPSYSFPRWYLGNALLRTGHFPEAFAELQRASEADPELRGQLFNLAWEVYNKDFDSLKSAVGSTPEARAQFAQYLLGRGRFDDGLRLWHSLSDSEKNSNRATGETIIVILVGAKRFHQAVDVWNDLAPTAANHASIGHFVNGGFEYAVAHGPGAVFDWQVQSVQQAQIAIDPNQGHDTARSLRLVFQVRSRLESINLSQLVPVEPNAQYDFECYFKTDKLESAATPLVAIIDATDGAFLASSDAAPTGTNDWRQIRLTFKTGAKTEAIFMRVNRASCGENTVCPVFGTVWYDDFDLKRRS